MLNLHLPLNEMGCWIGCCQMCRLILFGILIAVFQACQANPGQEFIVALPQNDLSTLGSSAYITPSTDSGIRVQVEIYTLDRRINERLSLGNGRGNHLKLPSSLNFPLGSLKSDSYTLYVKASHNITIIVRSFGKSNQDSYMALPVSQFGTEYMAVSYEPSINEDFLSFCFIVVMAAFTPANVNITLPIPTVETNPRKHFLVFENMTFIPGDIIRTSLEPYEAVQIQAPFDLTGALVVSDAPVAAWSGVNRTNIGRACLSHLLQMLPPTSCLGTKYVLAPAPIETPTQEFRIVAYGWSTRVRIYQSGDVSPIRYILPRPGSYVQYTSTNQKEFAYLEASKAVIVSAYLSSRSETTEKGDAFMNLLMAVGSVEHSFYRFTQPKMRDSEVYMTIVIAKGLEDNLILNGDPIASYSGTDSLEIYDVQHRTDLLVLVALVTQDIYMKTFDIRHTNDATFMIYIGRFVNCEGEMYPLGYSKSLDPPVESDVQAPRRCQSVDTKGESLVTLPELAGKNQCCVRGAEECDCSVTRSRHKCFLLDKYRIADDMKSVMVSSLLRCQEQCHAHPSCNGINYGQSAEPADRCQLLIGQFYGLVSNGVHNFLYCRSKAAMKFGSSCTS